MENHIDGIWISNGLRAEFIVIRKHPNAEGIYFVRTATGDHYAKESELHFGETLPETKANE